MVFSKTLHHFGNFFFLFFSTLLWFRFAILDVFHRFKNLIPGLLSLHHIPIVPFDTRLLKIAETIKGLEAHDRLILATAILTGSPLVSNDREIHAKGIKELRLYGKTKS